VPSNATQIIVLPDPAWVERSSTIGVLENVGWAVLDVQAPLESKSVCAVLISAELTPPLLVIAHGDACLLLPAVALSLRTQHRDTAGYVLVDPDAPQSTDIWPEAPVFVVSESEDAGTSLRGWEIVSAPGGIPDGVAEVAARVLEQ